MMEDKNSTGDPEIPGGGTSSGSTNISEAPQAGDPEPPGSTDTQAYGETGDGVISDGASSISEDTAAQGDPEIPGGGTKLPGGGSGG